MYVIAVAERVLDAANRLRLRAEDENLAADLRGLFPRLGDVGNVFAIAFVIDDAAAVEDAVMRGEVLDAGVTKLCQPHEAAAGRRVVMQRQDAERILLERPKDRIQLGVVLVACDEQRRCRQILERVEQRLRDRQREVARVGGVDEREDRIDDDSRRADLLDVVAELVDDRHHVRRTLDEVEVPL